MLNVRLDESISRVEADLFIYSRLSDRQKSDVKAAMFEQRVPRGTDIIVQGTEGDYFYIIESGELPKRSPHSKGHTQGSKGHTQGSKGHTQGSKGHAQGSKGHAQGSKGKGHTQGSNGHTQGSKGHTQGSKGHAQGSKGKGHTQGSKGTYVQKPLF